MEALTEGKHNEGTSQATGLPLGCTECEFTECIRQSITFFCGALQCTVTISLSLAAEPTLSINHRFSLRSPPYAIIKLKVKKSIVVGRLQ